MTGRCDRTWGRVRAGDMHSPSTPTAAPSCSSAASPSPTFPRHRRAICLETRGRHGGPPRRRLSDHGRTARTGHHRRQWHHPALRRPRAAHANQRRRHRDLRAVGPPTSRNSDNAAARRPVRRASSPRAEPAPSDYVVEARAGASMRTATLHVVAIPATLVSFTLWTRSR